MGLSERSSSHGRREPHMAKETEMRARGAVGYAPAPRPAAGRSFSGRDLLVWTATLLAFPLAGLAGRAVAGPVDATWTAVLAGTVAGFVLGGAQWLVLRRIGADVRWIAATAAGLGVGLGLALAIFGYGDSIG